MIDENLRELLLGAMVAGKEVGGNLDSDDRLVDFAETLIDLAYTLLDMPPPPLMNGDLIAELKKLRSEVWG